MTKKSFFLFLLWGGPAGVKIADSLCQIIRRRILEQNEKAVIVFNGSYLSYKLQILYKQYPVINTKPDFKARIVLIRMHTAIRHLYALL
jgi:hypothetical protein